jgi:hypothetical protein
MACALTQSFPLGCRDSVGGIKTLYITEQANLASITTSGSTVTAITLNSGKVFWTYSLRKATSEFTEAITTSEANGSVYYKDDIKAVLYKLDANKQAELANLAQNLLLVIVLDNNGSYWLTGLVNGAQLQTSQAKTGKAFGDLNGYDLSLEAEEPQPAYNVPSNLIAALL